MRYPIFVFAAWLIGGLLVFIGMTALESFYETSTWFPAFVAIAFPALYFISLPIHNLGITGDIFSENELTQFTPILMITFIYIMFHLFNLDGTHPRTFGTMVLGVLWAVGHVFLPALLFYLPYSAVRFAFGVFETDTFRQWFTFGQGGRARWAGPNTYQKAMTSRGIFLGSTLFQDTVFKEQVSLPTDDDAHMVTIAQTGAGKSVTALWPSIYGYSGPMVVLDPKGEHASFAHAGGGFSYVLDPFSKVENAAYSRIRYNPLAELDVNSDHIRAYLNAISDACVFEEKGENAHFSESAKTILEGVIIHVLTHFPKEQQTLTKVADMFRGYDPVHGVSDPKEFDKVIVEMSTNEAAGGIAMDAAGLLLSAGDRERGSMLTTCFRSLKWTTDPAMRRQLVGDDKNEARRLLSSLVQSQNNRVFIVLPFEYMEKGAQIRWMRTMVNLINVHLFQNPRDRSQAKLLFVLDEFFKLGYMSQIEEGIVTARGAGAKYWVLIQNIGQLKERYNKNWETFVGSSNVQVFGVNDEETAKWTAAAVGGDRDRDTGYYPLMRPDEVRQFLGKESATQIIIPATGLPMRLERLAYQKTKQYRGRF